MTRFLGIDRLDYSEWPHRCGAGTPRGGRWGPPLREPELSFRSPPRLSWIRGDGAISVSACKPHSVFWNPDHLPARASSPGRIARVQCVQPMLVKLTSCKGL